MCAKKLLKSGKRKEKREALVSQVEEAVQEKAEKDRILGKISDEPTAQPLFVLDTKGDDELLKAEGLITKSGKRKTLRLDEILNPENNSKIIVPSGRVRPAKKIDPKDKKAMGKLALKKVPKKLVLAMMKGKETKVEGEKESMADKLKSLEWVEPPKEIKKPETVAKKSVEGVPSVAAPHPGLSYNPHPEDHNNLINQIVKEELDKEKMLKEIAEKAVPLSVIKSMKNHDLSNIEILIHGVSKRPLVEDKENGEENDDAEMVSYSAPVPRRKTRSQRNRESALKKEQDEVDKVKQFEKIEKQVDNINRIKNEISKSVAKKEDSDATVPSNPSKKLRLSKFKYEPELTPVKLPSQVGESLRLLKAEGNLFSDRFKSLQERCLIEPRLPTSLRPKYKRKFYESVSSRNFQ